MIGSIISGIHRPARNRGRKAPREGDVDERAPLRGLEGGRSSAVLGIEAMSEDKVLEVSAPGILIRAIENTMGVRVHGQKKSRRVLINISDKSFEPVREHREHDV